MHGGGGHPESTVPGVAEAHLGGGLDPAPVTDEVVAPVPAEQARVDGDGAGEALGAEVDAADGAAAGVAHRHLEHRVVPGLVARVGLRHRHARRQALAAGPELRRVRRRRRRRPCTCTHDARRPPWMGQQPPFAMQRIQRETGDHFSSEAVWLPCAWTRRSRRRAGRRSSSFADCAMFFLIERFLWVFCLWHGTVPVMPPGLHL